MVAHESIDEDRIAQSVRGAEAGTSAELVCVLARASSAYEFYPLIWAALAALTAPWPLIRLTRWSIDTVFGLQLAVFLVGLAVLSLPALRMRLVPRAIQRRRAHRAAAEQFILRGLHRKRDRTGVLIFVSEAERYARIIADEGVARRIEPARWDGAVAQLLEHARAGRLTEGYVAAVATCGAVLAEHLPPRPDARNELSDSFFVV